MLKRQYAFPIAVLVMAAIVGAIVLIINSGGNNKPGKKSAIACEKVAALKPRKIGKRKPPTLRLDPGKTYTAAVDTSCGTFLVKLDSREAPRTTGSFILLARSGFYDGLDFHRVAPGFAIQGGDPKGDGSGGPGYSIREPPPRDVVYSEGVVAMAKTQAEPPGTSGSQFFVVTSDNAGLPPDYALLGMVTKGLDVVHAIEALGPSGGDGPPSQPVVIRKIAVSGSE